MSSFNKKLLIYFQENKLNASGGPAGYNYALRMGLNNIEAKGFKYLPEQNSIKRDIDGLKNSTIKKILLIFVRIAYYLKLLLIGGGESAVDLSEYDVVHFHSVKDLYAVQKSLKSYKGKVVLTCHSPKPWFCELYDGVTDFERIVFGWLYRKMNKVDVYAFSRADYIFFPCEEAEEPYYKNWKDYYDIKLRYKKKYRYILTGTYKHSAKESASDIKRKLNIPQNQFIISYVGRHNTVKGYDQLIKLAQKLSNDRGFSFLIAGKEGPLFQPDMSNWIEVGWTTDPHSYIAASDIFILPNRETYFDLILLEVLSLGKIVVASRTGGNRYFEKIGAQGVFLYEDIDEAIQIIENIRLMSSEQRQVLGDSNRSLFEERFIADVFAQKYVELINSL